MPNQICKTIMKFNPSILFVAGLLLFASCNQAQPALQPEPTAAAAAPSAPLTAKVVKTDEEWRKELSEMEYNVLRQSGTERAFTGKYWDNHENGTYLCRGCGEPLFSSKTKFESGTGWPSFYEPLNKTCIADLSDDSHGMARTEVRCNRCDGHLGHVFDDGPKPTGLRYCLNSAALKFEKE